MGAVPLPAGFRVRGPTMEDLPAAFETVVAHEVAEYGEPDTLIEDMREEWEDLDLAADAFLALSPEGRVAGVATVEHQEPVRIREDVYVHPEYRGLGVATHLLLRTEARAAEIAAQAPAGRQVVLDNYVSGTAEAAAQLLLRQGYVRVRQHWRMLIRLDAPPPEPEWPAGISVRVAVRDRDERAIHEAIEEAFADHWGHEPMPWEGWRRLMVDTYRYDPSLWWVAEEGREIAGAALGVDFPDMGWVRLLGVRRPWRRRGLATALLRQSFAEFHRRGTSAVGLGVDSESPTGATRLYQRAGMHVDKRFDRYRKILRSGDIGPDTGTV